MKRRINMLTAIVITLSLSTTCFAGSNSSPGNKDAPIIEKAAYDYVQQVTTTYFELQAINTDNVTDIVLVNNVPVKEFNVGYNLGESLPEININKAPEYYFYLTAVDEKVYNNITEPIQPDNQQLIRWKDLHRRI